MPMPGDQSVVNSYCGQEGGFPACHAPGRCALRVSKMRPCPLPEVSELGLYSVRLVKQASSWCVVGSRLSNGFEGEAARLHH